MSTLTWGRYIQGDFIMVYASKLAQCANMHKYNSQLDAISEFKTVVYEHKAHVSKEMVAKAEMTELPVAQQEEIANLVSATYESATELTSSLCAASIQSLPPNILAQVKTDMYTKHGTEQESAIRQSVSATLKKKIQILDKFKAAKEPIVTVNGIEVYIGGKHDGMVDGKIVEIKTRQSRFLGTPVYELVQVHAYMYIFGTRQAMIVESYLGQERVHEIAFDDGFWDTVKSNMNGFVEELVIL